MNPDLNREFIQAQKAKIAAVYGDQPAPLTYIQKSEGEHGGHVIGHTTSGKPIYASPTHAEHSSFTAQDHQDASAAHGEAYKQDEDHSHTDARFHHLKQALR